MSSATAYLFLSPLPVLFAWAFHVALGKGQRDAEAEGIDPAPLVVMRWGLWPGWLAGGLTLLAAGLGLRRAALAALLGLAAAGCAVMLIGLVWLAVLEYAHWKRRRLQ